MQPCCLETKKYSALKAQKFGQNVAMRIGKMLVHTVEYHSHYVCRRAMAEMETDGDDQGEGSMRKAKRDRTD